MSFQNPNEISGVVIGDFLRLHNTTKTSTNSDETRIYPKMTLDKVTEAPSQESFTALADHQSETPTTFFGSKPVLHHHSPNATIVVAKSQYDEFTALHDLQAATTTGGSGASNGDPVTEMVTINGVDAWVTSK
jgi:nucleotide-sensitive chloride channel 1A